MSNDAYLAMTAIGTLAIALIAIATAIYQAISSRRAMSADVAFRLEEKFYHTELFREIRRGAAAELLQIERTPESTRSTASEKLPNFESLADFFEFIGALYENKALNGDICWNSFYRRAYAYWKFAEDLGVIKIQKGLRPTRWESYDEMLKDLKKIQTKKSRSEVGDQEIADLMIRESMLTIPAPQPVTGSVSVEVKTKNKKKVNNDIEQNDEAVT